LPRRDGTLRRIILLVDLNESSTLDGGFQSVFFLMLADQVTLGYAVHILNVILLTQHELSRETT
jgi:hypothetical protein